MPSKHDLKVNVEEAEPKLCEQCQDDQVDVENVRGRDMCQSCFCKYVGTKCVKRMEAFRTRHSAAGQDRLLLLSLSLGLSSVAMLQLLESQLERQRTKSGRTGFSLHVLHVDTSSIDPSTSDPTLFARIQERFPLHTYTSIPISDVMDLPDLEELLSQNDVPAPPTATSSASTTAEAEPPSNATRLSTFLSSLPSTTARVDVLQILRTKLIISFAKSLQAEAILWADTTTRLAEKTLSETAKGRGFGLAWAISDGPTPHGVKFYYPMRELLKKELVAYAEHATPPLTGLFIAEKKVSTVVNARNSSIDELMRGYFEGVERSYPSIVANVVRTTGKLVVPSGAKNNGSAAAAAAAAAAALDGDGDGGAAEDGGDVRCGLCGLPVISAGREDGFAVAGIERHGIQFCHGCARSFPLSSA